MSSNESGRGVGRAGCVDEQGEDLMCRLVSSSISLSFYTSMSFPMFQLHNGYIFVAVA